MLLSVFSTLYELVIGENSSYPEYQENIFSPVGIYTIALTLLIAIIFYVVLGRWKPIFHKLLHWVITLLVVAVSSFCLAFFFSRDIIGATDSYTIMFAAINLLYGLIYFCLFSFALKRTSIFAKSTPF